MSELHLTVNGLNRDLGGAGGHTTLLQWLREQGLTGTKEGCAEGECGACAVMVARPDGSGGTRWEGVNSCLIPALSLAGQEVVTAEGLSHGADLHPVQQEMAVRGGSQCGYCTPGFVVSLAAEYYRPDRAGGQHGAANGFDLHALSGNLCRCTGYRPIKDAAYALGFPAAGERLADRRSAAPAAFTTLQQSVGEGVFFRPTHLAEALDFYAQHPDAKLVAGSTDWGVEVNLRHFRAAHLMSIAALPELRGLVWNADHVLIGAGLTLSEIERELDGKIPLLAQMFPQFASRLIRNGATLGGNLGTASPIGDSAPALLALDASLVLTSQAGEREVPLSQFFSGYRQTVLRSGELIRAVKVPLPLAPVTAFYKVAKRRFDDISSVAIALALDIQDGVVRRARIGLGGVAATPLRAQATEAALEGQPWNEATVQRAAQVLGGEGTPLDDHRASAAYRRAVLGQALRRFYAEFYAEVSP